MMGAPMMAPMMMPMGSMMGAPQAMMNPYLNPMASGMPQPATSGYGAPAQMPSMPFFPQPMPMMAPTGQMMPVFPMMPPPAADHPAAAPTAGNPFDPAMWMQMMNGMAPAAPAQEPAK
jgi:hypothetical protein